MTDSEGKRFSHRWKIALYLFAIAGPTVVLLYLGLQSVQRQQEAITKLTTANARLMIEKLSEELERRTRETAESCLFDDQSAQLPVLREAGYTPAITREVREALERIRARCPIAEHFFILQEGEVRFPPLVTPLPLPLDVFPFEENASKKKRFLSLLTQAENLELVQRRPDRAISLYRQASELEVSESSKAFALTRVARCLRSSNQAEQATETYRGLLKYYSDFYDPFHRPYGLIAAIELYDLTGGRRESATFSLEKAYKDVLRGRWELSAEQVDYFVATIEERLERTGDEVPDTPYLRHLKLARALQEGFHHAGSLQSRQLYTYSFSHEGRKIPTFYAAQSTDSVLPILIGFTVDLKWVGGELLNQSKRNLDLDEDLVITLKESLGGTPSANTLTSETMFRSWELSLLMNSENESIARHQVLFFGGAILMVLSVLGIGVFLLLRDVSREAQLARLREDFVSGVSHELKTPLTLIRLYGETLLYGNGFSEEDRKNYYKIITQESERLTHLIEKVLDLSRLDRGRKEYNLSEGNLMATVEDTVELFGQYLIRQGFRINTDLAPQVPPVVFDKDAVSEAVLNLMDNAAKFSDASKYIGVRLWFENSQVLLEVEDHGAGIPASERTRIFEQFYRTGSSKEKRGYGLGLFLVKQIMDAHRGNIEVDSEAGRGTRIRLIFPVSHSSIGRSQ